MFQFKKISKWWSIPWKQRFKKCFDFPFYCKRNLSIKRIHGQFLEGFQHACRYNGVFSKIQNLLIFHVNFQSLIDEFLDKSHRPAHGSCCYLNNAWIWTRTR